MSVAQLFLTEAAGCPPLPLQVSMPFFLSYGSPLWLSDKESACNAGDAGSILESERSPGERNGNPLQYSCLENSMNRGAGWSKIHGVTKESVMT